MTLWRNLSTHHFMRILHTSQPPPQVSLIDRIIQTSIDLFQWQIVAQTWSKIEISRPLMNLNFEKRHWLWTESISYTGRPRYLRSFYVQIRVHAIKKYVKKKFNLFPFLSFAELEHRWNRVCLYTSWRMLGAIKNKLCLFTFHGEQQQQQHEQKQQDMQLSLESWIESELKCYQREFQNKTSIAL